MWFISDNPCTWNTPCWELQLQSTRTKLTPTSSSDHAVSAVWLKREGRWKGESGSFGSWKSKLALWNCPAQQYVLLDIIHTRRQCSNNLQGTVNDLCTDHASLTYFLKNQFVIKTSALSDWGVLWCNAWEMHIFWKIVECGFDPHISGISESAGQPISVWNTFFTGIGAGGITWSTSALLEGYEYTNWESRH